MVSTDLYPLFETPRKKNMKKEKFSLSYTDLP